MGALVVPAPTHENRTTELMPEHLTEQGVTDHLEPVAHGRLGRARRLAKSFENTTTSATGWLRVACIATTPRHLPRARTHRQARPLAA